MKSLINLSISLMFCACASTTIIRTQDPSIDIYTDDKFLSKGNAIHTDRKIVFLKTKVTLKKEGCLDQTHYFRRNEKFDLLPIIFVLPILWGMKYNAVHYYPFKCQGIDS